MMFDCFTRAFDKQLTPVFDDVGVWQRFKRWWKRWQATVEMANEIAPNQPPALILRLVDWRQRESQAIRIRRGYDGSQLRRLVEEVRGLEPGEWLKLRRQMAQDRLTDADEFFYIPYAARDVVLAALEPHATMPTPDLPLRN